MEEVKQNLSLISSKIGDVQVALSKLVNDSEDLEARIVRVEQQIEVNSHAMKNFWERDMVTIMGEMKSISDKVSQQLNAQFQSKSELDLLKQKLDLISKVYDEKLSKLEKQSEENQLALWKLIGAGAGSGAIISGLVELVSQLLK